MDDNTNTQLPVTDSQVPADPGTTPVQDNQTIPAPVVEEPAIDEVPATETTTEEVKPEETESFEDEEEVGDTSADSAL